MEEFCKRVYVKHLESTPDGLFIIWGWTEESMDEKNASDDDPALMSDSLSTESDKSDDECAVSKEISTVNFKCVGVTRDPLYQETLKLAFDMLIRRLVLPMQYIPHIPRARVITITYEYSCTWMYFKIGKKCCWYHCV